jgi:predicted transcriptional regulator
MKKLKNEIELTKKAIRVGMVYAEKRGVVKFEATDSANDKAEYLYRLLVHDKLIHPLAKDQLNLPNMKHKLAIWVSHQLPKDHPLLQ